MLAGRELSVEGVRARLQDRGYPPDEIASAIERLIESGGASAALGEVYAELDERALIDDALRRKLRGRTRLNDQREYARIYQFLLRQGFSPAGVAAALRRFRSGHSIDQD